MEKEIRNVVARELRQAIYPNQYGVNTRVFTNLKLQNKKDIHIGSDLLTEPLINIIRKIVEKHELSWYVGKKLHDIPQSIEVTIFGEGKL